MHTVFPGVSRKTTKVTILATYKLVQTYLKLLLDGDRQLNVLDTAGSTEELIESVSKNGPDVVLISLEKDEGDNLEVLSELFTVAPHTKVVLLARPDSALDQPAALKLGVTGIVGTNQNPKVLIRAITQVSDGEVWLNQKLIAQLLGKSFGADGAASKGRSFYSDDLTHRELEVVRMIGLGMKNKDISKRLFISEATVRHHLSSIYGKLNIEDRLNLAIYAYRERIVQPALSAV